MTVTVPALPAEIEAARDYFRQEHDPAEVPFAALGDSLKGLLIYIPGGLSALNLHTVLRAVNVTLEHPDRMAEFLIDLEARA